MKRILLTALVLVLTPSLRAEDKKPEAKDLVREIAPYLDDQFLALAHADLSGFDPKAVAPLLEKAGIPKDMVAEGVKGMKLFLDGLKGAGLKRVYAVVSLTEFPDQPPLLVLPLEKGANADMIIKLMEQVVPNQVMTFEKRDGVLIGGIPRTLNRVAKLKPAEQPELAQTLTRLGDASIKVVLNPTKDMRKAFAELSPTLPRELGGGPSTILTNGLRWLGVAVSPPPDASVRLTIQALDETSAKALTELTRRVLARVAKQTEVRDQFPDIDKLLALLQPKQNGDRIEIGVKEESLVAVLMPMLNRARDAASREIMANNYKQIALAFHTYAAANNDRLPAQANYTKDDKPLLSWRVHLLPYIEQDNLYKQFKLNEPWDSEHNKKLIKQMPVLFAPTNPKLAGEGKTTMVVPFGPNTVFADKKGIRFQEVEDGTSNTVFTVVVDDDHAVIWTKPDDWKFDPKAPSKGLRKFDGKVFLFGFMDGSVRYITSKIDDKTIKALITPSGAEVIQLP